MGMNSKKRRQKKKLAKTSARKERPAQNLNEALKLYQSGNLKLALRKCELVLAAHAKQPQALNLGGLIFLELGQAQQSVKLLRSLANPGKLSMPVIQR
jgi:uncharacterized protein HemY